MQHTRPTLRSEGSSVTRLATAVNGTTFLYDSLKNERRHEHQEQSTLVSCSRLLRMSCMELLAEPPIKLSNSGKSGVDVGKQLVFFKTRS